jgi:hypothetical protein
MTENLEDWQEKRKNYLAVTIICFLIGTYFFVNVMRGSYIIKPSYLTVYEKLITAEAPQFKETTGKNRKRWIEFKCIDNRSTFKIASYDYRCGNRSEILNEIKAGDTISIKVLNSETGDFDAETSCKIHSLIKNDKEYLNIECRNRKDNKDGKKGFMMLFAISLMTGTVYLFSQKPKFFDHVDPRVPIWIVIILLFFLL